MVAELPVNWLQQNVHNLIYALLVVAYILFDRKVHFLKWFKEGGYTGFLYHLIGYVVFVGFVFDLFFLDFERGFPSNIALFRAFNSYAVGHWLIWIAVFIVFVRFGFTDVVRGLIYAGLLAALHEGIWFIVYFVEKPQNFVVTAIYYSPLFALLLSFFLAYEFLLQPKDKLSREHLYQILMFTGMFYLIWALGNFPITADNITGPTNLFNDLPTNILENSSWLIMAVAFVSRKLGQ